MEAAGTVLAEAGRHSEMFENRSVVDTEDCCMAAVGTAQDTLTAGYDCLAVVGMVLCSLLASLLTSLVSYPNTLGITYKETNITRASNTAKPRIF